MVDGRMWGSPASNQQAAANYDDNRSAAVRFHWIRTAQRWPFFFFSRTNWFNSLCLTFNNFFKLKSRRLMTAMQMRGCGTLRYDLADEKNWSNQQSPTGSEVDLISFDYFQKIVYLLFCFFKKKCPIKVEVRWGRFILKLLAYPLSYFVCLHTIL